jgi:hypothetical protein
VPATRPRWMAATLFPLGAFLGAGLLIRPNTRLYGVVTLVCTVLLIVALNTNPSISDIGTYHRVVPPR